jgi:hypothetical protein
MFGWCLLMKIFSNLELTVKEYRVFFYMVSTSVEVKIFCKFVLIIIHYEVNYN